MYYTILYGTHLYEDCFVVVVTVLTAFTVAVCYVTVKTVKGIELDIRSWKNGFRNITHTLAWEVC